MVSTLGDTSTIQAGTLPQIHLAGDLGKSGCKFLWTTGDTTHPLWLSSDIVQGVSDESLRKFEVGGELSEALWLRTNGSNVLVGGSATGFSTAFAADKIEVAALQVAAALGLIATQSGISEYRASVALAIPLNEFRFRDEINARLQEMAKGTIVCGREQRFSINLQFFPEGMGLFLLYKAMKTAINPEAIRGRVVVLMMGHRNLSVLVFENGKLAGNLSQTSDELGFWHTFTSEANSSGVRETDYQPLLRAVTSGNHEQLSITKAKRWDFSSGANAVTESYLKKVEQFCKDHVLKHCDERTTIVLGGGASHVARQPLRQFFTELGYTDERLWFADNLSARLLEIARASRGSDGDLARPIRYADCFGIYQWLLGNARRSVDG